MGNESKEPNAHAKALGRLGGLATQRRLTPEQRAAIARLGGRARAIALTPARRRNIAKAAARKRWAKKHKEVKQ